MMVALTWGVCGRGGGHIHVPTGMTLGLGGARPPPHPHLTLIPRGVRAAWGHGGGRAPPRASVMSVGHMDASTPTPPSSHVGRGQHGGGCIHVPHPHDTGSAWGASTPTPPSFLPLPPSPPLTTPTSHAHAALLPLTLTLAIAHAHALFTPLTSPLVPIPSTTCTPRPRPPLSHCQKRMMWVAMVTTEMTGRG